jgi:hypothetical protein
MATDGLRLGYLDKYRLMGGKGVIFPDSYRSGYGSGAHHGEPGPGPWGVQLAKPLRELVYSEASLNSCMQTSIESRTAAKEAGRSASSATQGRTDSLLFALA